MTESLPSSIRPILRALGVAAVALALGGLPAAAKERVLAAVAANFAEAMAEIEPLFEDAHPEADLVVTTGSTGKLYAQIKSAAPFDLLLAADQARPARLEEEGDAVPGARFTYAVGRLTLWSPDPARIRGDGIAAMTDPETHFIAIANPDLAPYGAAAEQALAALGIADQVRGKLVMGQNIGQTFSMVATGNAEMGLVALSAALSPRNAASGSRWDVPRSAYEPIRQDAALLNGDNAAARAFLDFLKSDEARAVIARFGYGVE
ncbi:molybdate ABC transporter substrate-binding protein [Actibacterium sp. MT2.3-13A]|uniref:molybdate ABC transporter substrate-binding protein n=1 Tax=Actibacterium sp. MT2.3-13A TaxID=2828332 RepID=UPI0032C244F7